MKLRYKRICEDVKRHERNSRGYKDDVDIGKFETDNLGTGILYPKDLPEHLRERLRKVKEWLDYDY